MGYITRQFLAKRQTGTIEQKLQKKVAQAEKEAEALLLKSKTEGKEQRKALLETEQLLLKREVVFGDKVSLYE